MAVIALASVHGAPGVSTTCLGLALAWPRPVLLVEADPRGTSALLAGWFQGARPHTSGLVDLALSPLAVPDALVEVTQQLDDRVSFVAGLQSHAQAPALRGRWTEIAGALAGLEETGTDVIVDAGTLGFPGSPEPVLAAADLALLVLGSSLPALAGARAWAEAITRDRLWAHPGLLQIGQDPYRPREVARTLGLPVVASIAADPAAARVYSRGERPPRGFAGGRYVRSLGAAVSAIGAAVALSRRSTPGHSTSGRSMSSSGTEVPA